MAEKQRNRVADYAAFLAVRSIIAVIQMVSPRIAYSIADILAWLAFRFVKSRRRVALENVKIAFPELATNPQAAEQLVRDMYRHFMRAMVELAVLPRKLHVNNWRKFFSTSHRALPELLHERSLLIVTGHLGNWEMSGFALGLLGFRTHAIARNLDNPYLHKFALHFRQRTGQTIIAKKGDYDRLTTALLNGGKVATLMDQDAGPRGVFVDFFGKPASTHKAVALMAMEYDAVMLVIGAPRVNRADYPQHPDFDPSHPLAPMFYTVKCMDVIDPREYKDDPNAVKAITARYTTALERLIREHPEQYFWLHRRWKHQPKAKAPALATESQAA